jgi:hypothetical protein
MRLWGKLQRLSGRMRRIRAWSRKSEEFYGSRFRGVRERGFKEIT